MKLMDQVPAHLRVGHYPYRTEQSYRAWVRRFLTFGRDRPPGEGSWAHRRELGERGIGK